MSLKARITLITYMYTLYPAVNFHIDFLLAHFWSWYLNLKRKESLRST